MTEELRHGYSESVEAPSRWDFFYQLNVFPIEVPPLRERKDDILMLVEYFVQRYASRVGKNIRSIDKTLELLQSYDWPFTGEPRSEREMIGAALAESRGRVSGPTGATANLRTPPSTLEHKLKTLNISQTRQFKFGSSAHQNRRNRQIRQIRKLDSPARAVPCFSSFVSEDYEWPVVCYSRGERWRQI